MPKKININKKARNFIKIDGKYAGIKLDKKYIRNKFSIKNKRRQQKLIE